MKTFEELCAVEPRLKTLFLQVPGIVKSNANFWVGWGSIKGSMKTLVGFQSTKPEVGDCSCYEIAYQTLLAEAERVSAEKARGL